MVDGDGFVSNKDLVGRGAKEGVSESRPTCPKCGSDFLIDYCDEEYDEDGSLYFEEWYECIDCGETFPKR